jgi:hypothetical protein
VVCAVCSVRSASRLRAERNGLPRQSARHHVILLISFSFLFPSFVVVVLINCLALRSTQHVLQAATQDEYELCVPITVLSALTAFSLRPPFHFPFILHLWSRTLEQRLPTLSHYHAASVCSLIHPHLSFPLYAYTPYSIPITGTSDIASTTQIL